MSLQTIRSHGGLTVAQSPDSAQFDSMPKSAIVAGYVDIGGLPAELAHHILRVTGGQRHVVLPDAGNADVTPASNAEALSLILQLLRSRSKHDLSDYKPSTLDRRMQRRMGVHGLATLSDHAGFVRKNPQELDLLFKEMLIGVTSFFRDPDVWQGLNAAGVPVLLSRSAAPVRRRAWVVGCSTGEVASSLAMVFAEALNTMPAAAGPPVQIFASDLSADAVDAARKGRDPRSAAFPTSRQCRNPPRQPPACKGMPNRVFQRSWTPVSV